MNKKTIKFIMIILIILLIILFINNNVSYCKFTDVDIDGTIGGKVTETIKKPIVNVISIFSIIGSGISIIAIIVLGIKYMIGSLEQRAQYKKTLLPYLIGAIFVFGASIVPSMIYNIFK